MKQYLALAALFFQSVLCTAQDFLNGSFEGNTASDCQFNIDNSTFNSLMSSVRGIGDYQKLDIYYDTKCAAYGLAQGGHYYVDLENPIDFYTPTAISLELSSPLSAGKVYRFTYYDMSSAVGGGAVDFGLSDNNSSLGTLFHTQADSSETTWKKRTVSFTAPITGKYLTARFGDNKDGFIKLDNFVMDKGSSVTEQIPDLSVSVFPNPVEEVLQLRLPPGLRAQELKVFTLLGKQILHMPFREQIAVQALYPGMYLLEIDTERGAIFQKFRKQ